jgi:hypothetical protein
MKRQVGIFLVLTGILVSASFPAMAIDDIVIPIDTVVRSDEGELTQLASVAVDAELVGAVCTVSAEADNNESVHPNNDIIVSSGSDEVVLLDVEGADSLVTVASGTLTLGDTVLLTLRMGSDRVFSGGIVVTIDCETASTTTTVPEPTTTTAPEPTTPTTVPEPTTTTTGPEPTTTTTTPADGTTTTTAPPDATSTSTTVGTTTTTSPTQVRGVQIDQTLDQTDSLPFTGSEPETRFALAFYLITTGTLLYRLAADEIEARSRR